MPSVVFSDTNFTPLLFETDDNVPRFCDNTFGTPFGLRF